MNRENNCFIAIGRAVKTYGIKGELKVLLYNENSTILVDNLDIWFNINDEFVKYEIESIKSSQKYNLVKLKKYDNREILHSLIKSKTIFILRDKFPKLKTESFYLVDLIGSIVRDEDNVELGKVIDIISFPTNDSMLIASNDNNEFFIPIIDDFIQLFDLDNKMVIINNNAKGFLN